MMGRRKRDGEG